MKMHPVPESVVDRVYVYMASSLSLDAAFVTLLPSGLVHAAAATPLPFSARYQTASVPWPGRDVALLLAWHLSGYRFCVPI